LAVLVLLAVSGLLALGSLELTTSVQRTTLASEVRDREFFRAEEGLSNATSWMRANSTSMTYPFDRKNFYALFDRSAPTYGANDTTAVKIPTKIKLRNTQNSAILTNSTTLATAAYPLSLDTLTGASFNAATTFASAALGNGAIRVTLIDAIPFDATQDFGDPDTGAAQPNTDFYPIYRVDSMRTLQQGSHVFGYLLGELQQTAGLAFYGKDLVDARQDCDSYISTSTTRNYAAANRRAFCSVGSDGPINVQNNAQLYGSASTPSTVGATATQVCADFGSPCRPGPKCSGSNTCRVPGLPTFDPWDTLCPPAQEQPGATLAGGNTLVVAGPLPSQRCWNKINVVPAPPPGGGGGGGGSPSPAFLTTTARAYYIEEFDIRNNSTLQFSPDVAGGTITLYVKKFTGDKFNASQMINTNNRPTQLRINYLGTDKLTINGDAAMNAFITAPYATVDVQGNADYSGGIRAKSLQFTGNADIHYDESGDSPTLTDVKYRTRQMNQYYR
jgi:Tfp pilus assembly protein PilX